MTLHIRIRALSLIALCMMASGCVLPGMKVAPAGTSVTAIVT
jgi:hypothetical protein